jgi:uncharacterized protein YkwD
MNKFCNILKWTLVSLILIFTFLYVTKNPVLDPLNKKLLSYFEKYSPLAQKAYQKMPEETKNILSEAKISTPAVEDEFSQTESYPSIDCSNPASTPFTDEMFRLINQERQQDGKKPLEWSQKLCESAELKSQDMISNNYFDHVSPSGVAPWYWIKQAGYTYTFVGENLALNYYTAQSANTALMNSQGHRENILNENFTQMGVAYFRGKIDGQDAFVVVQHFGSPAPQKAALKYSCEIDKAQAKLDEFKKTKKKIDKYISEAQDLKNELENANQSTKEVDAYLADMKDKRKEVANYIKELEDYLTKCQP